MSVALESRWGLTGLQKLDLSSCSGLTVLPESMGRLTRLQELRECVVYWYSILLSNLYTAVDTPARGRVCVCVVCVCLVFACKYVLGHSRVSQPLNLRVCLLRHFGFLTSPHASPICRRRRLNSYRLFRRFTPDPPPIPWAYPLYLPTSPRPPLYTPTVTT